MSASLRKISLFLIFIFLIVKSISSFHDIAWGTGAWLGEYSFKWIMLFFVYILFCVFLLVVAAVSIWETGIANYLEFKLIELRRKLKWMKFAGSALFFVAPIYLFQFSVWGIVFHDIYIRVLIWVLSVIAMSFFMQEGQQVFSLKSFFVAALLTSSAYVVIAPFSRVSDYPFSLGWSEGNRMWDYSILFGRERYDYPANQDIYVLLDFGRQLVGGLPFLIPSLSIVQERFWLALTILIPYLLLGLIVFRFLSSQPKWWFLSCLWVLIFLKQGPIHPPLIFCALFVSLIWMNPLWLGIPLIVFVGCFASISRFTWLFAPAMWIVMLELGGGMVRDGKLLRAVWIRAILLGTAGVLGGYFGPAFISALLGGGVAESTAVDTAVSIVSSQSLLWYRLLPNATYNYGIVMGLVIAALPLSIVLGYFIIAKKWDLNGWQKSSIYFPLLAFLVVGLVVSTKIGGGGDLHNMDMFLIGLMFTTVLSFKQYGMNFPSKMDQAPFWIKVALIGSVMLPGLQSLVDLRAYRFAEDASWLAKLTDTVDVKNLDMYPSNEQVEYALSVIRENVEDVQASGGKVLFIDQRQLITFGYIKVRLFPEYEKKLLMEMALNKKSEYFRNFYLDLQSGRFDLIISEPLRTPIKDSSYQFGEENNAWVKWVSTPVLCYYEEKAVLKEVGVQLLVPKTNPVNCDAVLP